MERRPCLLRSTLRYAGRKVISPSLSLGQIQRVSDKKWLFGLPFQAAEQSDTSNGETVADVFADIPPWAGLIESAILRRDLKSATAELDALAGRRHLPPLAMCLIDFVRRTIVLPYGVKEYGELRAIRASYCNPCLSDAPAMGGC
jgi:hypothetical protein